MFVTVFTKAYHWCYPEPDESHTVTHFFCNGNFNGIFRLRSVPLPPAVSSLKTIRSNFLSIFRLPDTCHMFCSLSIISSTAGLTHTGRARLFGATRNRIPASVSHTKRQNQGKIKPTPTEMSRDEDIAVPVPWGWLLSADARSKGNFWMHPPRQRRGSHNDILPFVEQIGNIRTNCTTSHL